MVTSVGTMMALQAGAGSSAMMACIPFLPSWSQESVSQDALSQAPPISQRLRLLSHLVNGAALAQLTTAMLQFALNDPLSGLIGGGIAAIGWQTAHPAGFRLLPTYVVLSFCHGIMQVLLNLQLLASGVPLKAMTAVQAGFMGKVAVGTLLASPLVMFLGMGTGYWLHKESQQLLRSVAPVDPVDPVDPADPALSPSSPVVAPPAVPTQTLQDLRPPAPTKAAPQAAAPVMLAIPPAKSSNLTTRPVASPWQFPGTGLRLGPDSEVSSAASTLRVAPPPPKANPAEPRRDPAISGDGT